MKRKTMSVEALKNQANALIAYSEDEQKGYREGVIHFIERILLDTDNYNGFRYLPITMIPNGLKPGIRPELDEEHRFDDTDHTRVEYI